MYISLCSFASARTSSTIYPTVTRWQGGCGSELCDHNIQLLLNRLLLLLVQRGPDRIQRLAWDARHEDECACTVCFPEDAVDIRDWDVRCLLSDILYRGELMDVDVVADFQHELRGETQHPVSSVPVGSRLRTSLPAINRLNPLTISALSLDFSLACTACTIAALNTLTIETPRILNPPVHPSAVQQHPVQPASGKEDIHRALFSGRWRYLETEIVRVCSQGGCGMLR